MADQQQQDVGIGRFVALHQAALLASGVPRLYWDSLYRKLEGEIFDAGEIFGIMQVEELEEGEEEEEISENESEQKKRPNPTNEPSFKVIVTNEEGLNAADSNSIFLIDHAWTYRVEHARHQLVEVPGLLHRMANLMGIEFHGEVPDEGVVEEVLKEMWKYNQTYQLAHGSAEEKVPVWYIMDEFGSRIQHSDEPTFGTAPFYYLPHQIAYTILWPLRDMSNGEEVSRDYAYGETDPLIRRCLLTPWQSVDLSSIHPQTPEPAETHFQDIFAANKETLPLPVEPLLPDKNKVFNALSLRTTNYELAPVITVFSNTHSIMKRTRRSSYDASFKFKATDLAIQEGNRAAARKLGINESMVRRWRRQREEFMQCQKTKKAFRGHKSKWPELENVLEDWVNTQRAAGRGVSTVQIRLKAKTLAVDMNIESFKATPSWCFRFMRRKNLSIRARTTLCQQLLSGYDEKVANFHKYTETKIRENSIGPDDIINMDEVPLTFDLPLTRTVDKKGVSSVLLKTTGHERTHFTCILACTASGQKLPPMVIFKRITMPKEQLPKGIVVKVNNIGWMMECLMMEWLTECYSKRPGGFFHRKKALLVLDSMRAHITDSVKAAIKKTNSIPAVIPGGTTKYLQPLDISVNRAFKVAVRAEWETWMTSSEKSFTKTGCMRKASFSEVCQWILTAWNSVKESTITNGFRKAGLLRKESSAPSEPTSPEDDIDTESETDGGRCDDAVLELFNSDTEEDDFDGFSEDN